MVDEDEERRLAEMVREAERVIDHQVRAMEDLDGKTQRALTLGMAALGGGLALGSFAIGQGRFTPDGPFAALIAASGALNTAALLQLLVAYTGLRDGAVLRVGPSVSWLGAKALAADWVLVDHLRSVIASLAVYEAANTKRMQRTGPAAGRWPACADDFGRRLRSDVLLYTGKDHGELACATQRPRSRSPWKSRRPRSSISSRHRSETL